ncbi:GNAT family N-acetyltransferase [Sphingomonas xinjiangensis]|uniref:BioF2-like acetyltransferase domain-containing protein n=1 Tax=Sphingomonas xinjiangensis TaxID=643568 RepID=A0A840YMR1_9SPHN|nr:GNAT family N-acetyltransferase [Sphingomonas xinjiangensis]MBB5710980.1 hypothetical protein [Sphingomonas xinjiangensis]
MLATETGEAFHLQDGWFDAWKAAFGGAFQRDGLTLVDGRERLGPLGYRVLSSATNPHSVNYDVARACAVPPDLPKRLLTDAALVRLSYLHAESRLLAAAMGWRGSHRQIVAPHALTPVIDCRGSYDAWLAARSRRFRQRLRRDEAQATGAMAMRFEVRRDDPASSGLLQRMFTLEQAGWKGAGGTAVQDDAATEHFYTELARNAAAAGALRLALLWDGDRLVAFEYAILGGRRLFVLKVAYDERFADLSLGYVTAALHLRHCFAQPDIDRYDQMGNGMTPAGYKLRFTDDCETLYRVTLFAPGLLGTILFFRDRARARVKAWRNAHRARAKQP